MGPSPSPRAAAGAVAAFLIGLSFGASAFFDGFYSITAWGPIALVWLGLLVAMLIAAPARPRGPAALALGALLALALWSLLSVRWAESADQAMIDADRLLFYAAVLASLLMLLRGRGLELPLLGGIVAGAGAVALYVLGRMLAGDGSGLFLANRLNEPLNYVNGMGTYLLVGFWPLVAVAERARPAALRGAALGGAAALACLALLTQSRGALAAFLVSAVLLMAFAPGRLTRGWALLAVAAGVGASLPGMHDALAALPAGADAPNDGDLRTAGLALIGASALAGVAWGVACALAGRAAQRYDQAGRRKASAVVLCSLAAVGLIAVCLPPGPRVDDVRDQYDAFTELRPASDVGRFTSGGGNRYDYWRIALDQFSDDPLKGVGAGNYDRTYFLERRTAEDIRQPHSIELQALAETGLVGGLALAALLGAVFLALWRRVHAPGEERSAAIGVAAGGTFLVWLLQTSVDWMHLIPGLTGIALGAAAILLEPSMEAIGPARPRARVGGIAAGIAAAGVAAVLIALPTLSERLREDGEGKLASDPGAALQRARDALALNDESVPAYQLEAAALARFDDYQGARGALLQATRREPHDFVPWALLGDLATRRGDRAAARAYYERARQLNPRGEEPAESGA